jgi:hypothetical protein
LPDQRRLQALIARLDDQNFSQREAAARDLETLGELAASALRDAFKASTLEQRRRIEHLLARLEVPAPIPQYLRELRAIEVLERIGSAEARQVLESLSAGTIDAQMTREARAALTRLLGRD